MTLTTLQKSFSSFYRRFFTKVDLAFRLGIINILRIIIYRLSIKLNKKALSSTSTPFCHGEFFSPINYSSKTQLPLNNHWLNNQVYFSYITKNTNKVPNWHQNVLNDIVLENTELSWLELPDFSEKQGDIKGVWEASRFDWSIALAQQAATGKAESLLQLNLWLNDWVKNNSAYLGVNWKCGQESSIRVMHIAMSSLVLNQSKQTSDVLLTFIELHLKRISSTLLYALAQDNNHGTSEAAALYIGGSWLVQHGKKQGQYWQTLGEKWLINRAKKLIEKDGSFSQYSVTYHRVMLDTYCMVEVWRRHLNLPKFKPSLYQKLESASLWLFWMTQSSTGHTPNLGSNDGARLLPLTDTDYRDFRPSVQLACSLFTQQRAYTNNTIWDAPLQWLNIAIPHSQLAKPESKDFPDGGYCILINSAAFVLINYPRYNFRPHQNDSLHVDFWLNGENLLRDAGTFSYNHSTDKNGDFSSVKAHNTVEFDGHEQMPRFSRFLLSDWLKTDNKKVISHQGMINGFEVGYTDYLNCRHIRNVSLTSGNITIKDTLTGFKKSAVLRWRLKPSAWQMHYNTITDGNHCITIQANVEIKKITITKGYESLYYYQKQPIPVIEIEINSPGTITTEYNYKK